MKINPLQKVNPGQWLVLLLGLAFTLALAFDTYSTTSTTTSAGGVTTVVRVFRPERPVEAVVLLIATGLLFRKLRTA